MLTGSWYCGWQKMFQGLVNCHASSSTVTIWLWSNKLTDGWTDAWREEKWTVVDEMVSVLHVDLIIFLLFFCCSQLAMFPCNDKNVDTKQQLGNCGELESWTITLFQRHCQDWIGDVHSLSHIIIMQPTNGVGSKVMLGQGHKFPPPPVPMLLQPTTQLAS